MRGEPTKLFVLKTLAFSSTTPVAELLAILADPTQWLEFSEPGS
jgi:hypothetical protein